MKKIQHNKPSLDVEESSAISTVISSGWVAQGQKVVEFENDFCDLLNVDYGHSVAVSSGTAALYISLKIFDFPKHSEVIIPSYVCSALLNAIYMANLVPILVDVNPTDFNVNYRDVIVSLSEKTKAVIIPHMYGVPADIRLFQDLKRQGIIIIEDCATAIGSYISDKHVGTFGDISIFSLYASKFITCGNGGVIVSTDEELVIKARDYREFDCTDTYKPRFNFQLTDIQAVMGSIQLSKVDSFLERRNDFFDIYSGLCVEKGFEFHQPLQKDLTQNNYRFILKLESNKRSKLQQYLTKSNIGTIIPIEKYELLHNYLNLSDVSFEHSEKIAETTLSLPIYPTLTDIEFSYILEKVKRF